MAADWPSPAASGPAAGGGGDGSRRRAAFWRPGGANSVRRPLPAPPQPCSVPLCCCCCKSVLASTDSFLRYFAEIRGACRDAGGGAGASGRPNAAGNRRLALRGSGGWCGCGAGPAGAVGLAGEAEQRRDGRLGRVRLGRPGSTVAARRMPALAATCGGFWRHWCGRNTTTPAAACRPATLLLFFFSHVLTGCAGSGRLGAGAGLGAVAASGGAKGGGGRRLTGW